MLDKLGLPGVLGLLVLLGGIGAIASQNMIIAGGVALVIAGLGFLVYGMVKGLARSMGMDGMI
jgi:hypothetical protein